MIKLFEQYSNYSKVKKWLDKMGISHYTINDDLTVDVNGIVDLFSKDLFQMPVQFGRINSSFSCSGNRLTSLKGMPKYIGGSFHCSKNKLTSLEYAPEYIGGDFHCTYNELTTLKGCPEYIGGDFYCNDNKLTSLEYAPKNINDEFVFGHNPLPMEIIDLHIDHNFFLDNQEEYGVWNSDGTFNIDRFNILVKDYFNDFKFEDSDEEDED